MEQFRPFEAQKEEQTTPERSRSKINGEVFEHLIFWADQEMQKLGPRADRTGVVEWVLDNYKAHEGDHPGIHGRTERARYRRALLKQFGVPEAPAAPSNSRSARPRAPHGPVGIEKSLPGGDRDAK